MYFLQKKWYPVTNEGGKARCTWFLSAPQMVSQTQLRLHGRKCINTTLCENLSYLSSCFIPLTFYLIFNIFNILNPPGDLSINHEIYLEPPWRIEYNTCNIHPLNPLGDLSINHEISLEPSWRLENKTWNIPSSPWRLENKTWNIPWTLLETWE